MRGEQFGAAERAVELPVDGAGQQQVAQALRPLQGGRERSAPLYLVLPDPDSAGPGTRRLAAIIREEVARDCRERDAAR